MRKCKICRRNSAEWTMQQMEDGKLPTFTLPGNHYRGTRTIPVCENCRVKIKALTPTAANYLITLALEG